jgi:hypothetical protein
MSIHLCPGHPHATKVFEVKFDDHSDKTGW